MNAEAGNRDDPGSAVDARPTRPAARALATPRSLIRVADRAMLRASNAVQVRGNAARLLVDGPTAFQAWLAAIERAEEWIHLENYIIRDDTTGRVFREALAERARAGVRVRVLYDWLGCWATPKRFWRPLRQAGVEVRAFAPPTPRDPLNFFRRDHRKMLATDGSYASVSGMCIGDEWAGVPAAGIPPWRDTGIEFHGPVAAVIAHAFGRTWAFAGDPLPANELPAPAAVSRQGDVAVRVVEGEPGRSRIYRLLQLIAVGVERRLWMTDPYFVAPPAMSEALASAARDGVDVRVIVPAYNNWPLVGGLSRAGYRPLLDAGVRLFEWEGPMIHAKTAVADGVWSRVGSSNMNLASLLGNWEMDVAVTHRGVAAEMEALFLRDMESSVEIAFARSPRTTAAGRRDRRKLDRMLVERPEDSAKPSRAVARAARRKARRGGSVGRVVGRLARAGSVLGRALVGQREIGAEDRGWIGVLAVVLLCLTGVAVWLPRVLAWPLAFVLFWLGVASLFRAWPRDPGER